MGQIISYQDDDSPFRLPVTGVSFRSGRVGFGLTLASSRDRGSIGISGIRMSPDTRQADGTPGSRELGWPPG